MLEILVVLGIAILITTVSSVYLRSIQPQSSLNATAKDITGDIRLASELASTTQINHIVRFDLLNGSYTLARLTAPEIILKTEYLESKLVFSQTTLPQNSAEFNTLGASVAPGTVTLTHQNGLNITIDIRPSGYVRIQ